MALITVATLAACSSNAGDASTSGPSASPTSLNFSLAVKSPTSAAVYIAEDNGYFAAHGLKVTLVTSNGGSASLSAISSGNPPVGLEATFPTLQAAQKNYPVQAALLLDKGLTPEFVVTKQAASKNHLVPTKDVKQLLTELHGLTLGNMAPGVTDRLVLDGLMKQNGIPPGWIKYSSIRGATELLAAMQHGQIDGTLTAVPAPEQAVAGGYGVILYSLKNLPEFASVPYGDVVVNKNWLSSHTGEFKKVAAALEDATKFILANPSKAANLLHQKDFPSISVGDLLDTIKDTQYLSNITLTQADWQQTGDFANKYQMLDKPVTAAQLKASLAEGPFTG